MRSGRAEPVSPDRLPLWRDNRLLLINDTYLSRMARHCMSDSMWKNPYSWKNIHDNPIGIIQITIVSTTSPTTDCDQTVGEYF